MQIYGGITRTEFQCRARPEPQTTNTTVYRSGTDASARPETYAHRHYAQRYQRFAL